MSTYHIYLYCLIIGFSFITCKSAEDKYNNNDYKGAFYSALKAVKKNPKDSKHLNLLNKAYKNHSLNYSKEFARFTGLSNLKDKIHLFDWNQDLLSMNKDADQYLKSENGANYNDLLDQNKVIAQDITYQYLENGNTKIKKAESSQDINLARDGCNDYQNALKFSPNDPDILKLLEQGLKIALVQTSIEVEFWFSDYSSFTVDRAFDDLESTYNTYDKRYYNKSNTSDMDCQMKINLSTINYNTSESTTTKQFNKDIIDHYEKVKDANGKEVEKPIYKTVYATVTIYQRRKTASASADIRINERTWKCNLRMGNRFTEEVFQDIQSFESTGDSRAIPSEYKTSSSPNFKSNDNFAEELLNKLSDRIESYYW